MGSWSPEINFLCPSAWASRSGRQDRNGTDTRTSELSNLCFGYTLQNDLNDATADSNDDHDHDRQNNNVGLYCSVADDVMTIWVCGEKSVKGHPSSTVDMAIQMAHHHPVTYFVSSHLEG